MVEWNRERQDAAQQEGWDLFSCDGDREHPPFELSAIAAPCDWDNLDYTEPKFIDENGEVSDIAAWRHVVARAAEGSELHRAALDFLRDQSPEEYEHVSTLTPYV